MKIDKIDPTNRSETVLDDFRCKAEVLGSQVRLGEAEADQTLIDKLVHLVLQMQFWETETGRDWYYDVFFNELKNRFPNLDWDDDENYEGIYHKVVDKFGFREAEYGDFWLGNEVTDGFDDGMLINIPTSSSEWKRNNEISYEVEEKVLEQVMEHYRNGIVAENEVEHFNHVNDEVVAYVESLLALRVKS